MDGESVGYRRESSGQSSSDQAYDYQGRRLEDYGCKWIYGDRVSGRSMTRSGLRQALAKIESGEATQLVVTHIFRLGRSIDAYKTVRDIEAAGGRIVVLEGDVNTRTPEGRAMLQMQLVLGAMEAELAIERQKMGWQNSILKGRPRSKLFGYTIQDGKYVPDFSEVAGISRFELAGMAVAKYFELGSFEQLAKWVREHPEWAEGERHQRLSIHTPGLRRWLCREALQGHVKIKDVLHFDRHQPLITNPEWIAEIEWIAGRRGGYSSARKHPYSGLVGCSACGGSFVAGHTPRILSNLKPGEHGAEARAKRQTRQEGMRMYYRCSRAKRGQCENTASIRVSVLDAAVRRLIADNLIPLSEHIAAPIEAPLPDRVVQLQRQIDQISAAKSDPRVGRLIEEMELEIKQLMIAVGQKPPVDLQEVRIIAEQLLDQAAWDELEEKPFEKSSVLRSIIRRIWVSRADVEKIDWLV